MGNDTKFLKRGNGKNILDVINTKVIDYKPSYEIKNLNKFCTFIKSLDKSTEIFIIGDYDCDGVTSTSILKETLVSIGFRNVQYRIPKRLSEGYGLNLSIIDEINRKKKTEKPILITIDNGIAAIEAIKKAKEDGFTVIIVDHHQPKDVLPNADLIIDPHIENKSTFKHYCAAGLAYKIAKALTTEPKVVNWALSLAAIATIADVMPLVEENHKIVKEGMQIMTTKEGRNAGLYFLLKEAGAEDFVNEKTIGFKIAPMLNAIGRLEDDGGKKVVELLCCDKNNIEKAKSLVKEISMNNEFRKDLSKEGTALAIDLIEKEYKNDKILVLYLKGIPLGILGIISGKITEIYKRPSIVLSDTKDGILKGSGRSYSDFDIFFFFMKNKSLFVGFGGHPGACGCSIKKEDFEKLHQVLNKDVEYEIPEQNIYYYDIVVDVEKDDIEAILEIKNKYAPYGEGNPEPIIYIKNFYACGQNGKQHYSVMGKNAEHLKVFGLNFDIVAFDYFETYKNLGKPKKLEAVGCFNENFFGGNKSLQFEAASLRKNIETEKKKSSMQNLLDALDNL